MYKRYLNNGDYLGIITEENLSQLTRGNEDRLAMAEESAEESIIEYLTENYEIEKVLAIGKDLLPYNRQVSYPAGAHFVLNGKIYKATRPIVGIKQPANKVYWQEYRQLVDREHTHLYTQRGSYSPGDIVAFAGTFWECLEFNGMDYDDIRVPGLTAWEKIEVSDWVANYEYEPWNVVCFKNAFYALLSLDDIDLSINPHESENWGLIGSYDPLLNNYELSETEYVEYEGSIYYPVMNPNCDEPKEGYNITPSDPRHPNIKKHMLRMAIYELYKLVSPTNLSNVRLTDYETSVLWLRDASRLKINPQLPRRMTPENKPVTDFAIATYMRDYDPNKNPWQV